jgi:hypothetical protein
MAQWAWQYSGLSHATKVDDNEQLLHHAVEVFKAAKDEEKSKKAKSVKKLAAKVLNARLKMIKAKRSDVEPVKSEDWAESRIQVEHLGELESRLTSGGVGGILAEFGVGELAD